MERNESRCFRLVDASALPTLLGEDYRAGVPKAAPPLPGVVR
jgi:hypothetical protein